MTVTHNTAQVIQQTSRVQKSFALGSRKAASRAGKHIRDAIRDEIPAGGGRPAGNFEGYAATGLLRRNVVATKPSPRPRAGDWSVTVLVRSGYASDKYARIHNVGGVIRPKRADGWLTFKVRGRWVRVKQVRIRRKLYMSDGAKKALATLPDLIRGEIAREVR